MTEFTFTLTSPATDLSAFDDAQIAADNACLTRENAELRSKNTILEALLTFADARETRRFELAGRVCR